MLVALLLILLKLKWEKRIDVYITFFFCYIYLRKSLQILFTFREFSLLINFDEGFMLHFSYMAERS